MDAAFEDADRPLRVAAETADDVPVVSALLQDAVGVAGEMRHLRRKRRFVALLNRFRWEDAEAARRAGRPFERVRCVLSVEGVEAVRARGLSPADPDQVVSILSMGFQPGEDGAGRLLLALAGDGDIALDVEAIDLTLTDVARPHVARGAPAHDGG